MAAHLLCSDEQQPRGSARASRPKGGYGSFRKLGGTILWGHNKDPTIQGTILGGFWTKKVDINQATTKPKAEASFPAKVTPVGVVAVFATIKLLSFSSVAEPM